MPDMLVAPGEPLLQPWPPLPFLTQNQRGNEGCCHTAGTEQEGMGNTKMAIRDPAKDDSCNGCQEAHHCGLHLQKRLLTWEAYSRVLLSYLLAHSVCLAAQRAGQNLSLVLHQT